MAAAYYATHMGFKTVAYRGLETGSRNVASHVVSNGHATFVLTSVVHEPKKHGAGHSEKEAQLIKEIQEHTVNHGDGVKDVAFAVDDVKAVYDGAVAKGAISIQEPSTICDEYGEIEIAVIKTFGDTTHTMVNRSRYDGAFLPGYRAVNVEYPVEKGLPEISFEAIDHCVGNQDWDGMKAVSD